MAGWVFRNYGLIDQYQIETEEDLERIDELDKARWAATSAPLEQLQVDGRFLAFLDTDGNQRIRVNEVKAARAWAWAMLQSRARLVEGSDVLQLSDLSDHETARQMRALAAHLNETSGATDRGLISLADVRAHRQAYVAEFPNGDGVLPVDHVEDESLHPVIAEIIACTGGAPDLGGATGVRAEDIDAWRERVEAVLAWRGRITSEADTLLPLGEDTDGAAALVAELSFKVDQFFSQCALLALEANAGPRLEASEEQLAALDVQDPAAVDAWLAEAPLSRPHPDGVLPLTGQINARYAAELGRISADVAPRLLGSEGPVESLTRAEWRIVRDALAPYVAWKAAQPEGVDAALSDEHLQGRLDSPAAEVLRALCAEDASVADELVQFDNLEKIIAYQRWLMQLANNFVSFPALFDANDRALFEMGTLILDGRRVNLCVNVTNRAAHKAIAARSLMFVVYLDLVRKDGSSDVKRSVAAAVTAGLRGGIDPGKRGVFYDRDDVEWDALIVDLIAQPISVWEAMIAPFARLRDMIASRVEKFAGNKAAGAEKGLAEQASATGPPSTAAPAAEPSPAASGGFQNMLIGGTVAFAAAGGALALVVQTIAGISPLTLLAVLGGIIAVVMAFSGFLGWLKLRRRDVATLLEACGWALNGRMRLTRHLANLFTLRPGLPRGAVRKWSAPRSRLGWLVLVLVLIVAAGVVAYALHPGWIGLLTP